jgi:hypothetical protein
MEYLVKTVVFLQGKKTYLVGSLMILLGYLQGNNQLVLEGLSVVTLRAGIKKLE